MNTRLENGKQLLVSLKLTARPHGIVLKIPIGTPVCAFLRPVAINPEIIAHDDAVIMSEWRNLFVTHFLTEFHATTERTKSWLVNTVGPNDSKILFMLDLPDGTTVGHIGIDLIDWKTGYAEADAIVRGRDAPKGIMRESLLGTISWAKNQLGIKSVGVRVRSDNPALGFYIKIGFVETKRLPLRRIDSSDMVRWIEDVGYAEANIFLVYMIYAGNL